MNWGHLGFASQATTEKNNRKAKHFFVQIKTSADSFMPQGLLQNLNERERIELFKYLMTL